MKKETNLKSDKNTNGTAGGTKMRSGVKTVSKVTLCLMLVCLSLSLFACGKTTADYVLDNMSEWTKVYYYGESDGFYVSISSGTRENPYLLNGSSEDDVDFALVSVYFDDSVDSSVIKVSLTIDETQTTEELELNSFSNCFMVDLETLLSGDEEIIVEYDGSSVTLENLSSSFVIDDEEAIQIATEALAEEITKLKVGSTLNAECYLIVLDKKANNFDSVFWCFTVVNADNETHSIIISTEDGSILAQS